MMAIAFTATGTYTITDPLGNVLDTGTYIYTKTGDDTGEVRFTSNAGVDATCLLTFTNEGAGNFSITAPTGSAQGTFS